MVTSPACFTRAPAVWALGALLLSGCAPTISTVHAQAVRDHLATLRTSSQRMAADAPHHPRCNEGDAPVSTRAAVLHEDLSRLAEQADDHADGSWPDKESFQDALNEGAGLQGQLSILHAEYDACRALSSNPVDADGVRFARGMRRLAALQIQDLGTGIAAEDRLKLQQHLWARLSAVFALVPQAVVAEAQQDHRSKKGCEAACALAVAQEVGAHKTLALRLTRVDERCSVVLELYDLQTQMAERARTVRNDCSPSSLMAGLEDAIAPLVDAPQ